MRVSFQERVPIVAEVLRRLGRAATIEELYDELRADDRFANPRRIGAMFRRDQKQPQPVFVRDGKDRFALRNPTDAVITWFPAASGITRTLSAPSRPK